MKLSATVVLLLLLNGCGDVGLVGSLPVLVPADSPITDPLPTPNIPPTPLPPLPTADVTLLEDDFNRQNSADVGNGWMEDGQDVCVQGGKMFFAHTGDLPMSPIVTKRFPEINSGTLVWAFDIDWIRTGSETTFSLNAELLNADTGDVAVQLSWSRGEVPAPSRVVVQLDLDTDRYIINGQDHIATDTPINAVRFYTDALNHINFSGRTFDNIKISTGGDFQLPLPVDGTALIKWSAPIAYDDGGSLTVAGYRVYRSMVPDPCSSPLDVVEVASGVGVVGFSGLDSGKHYFRITALDAQGVESVCSLEVFKEIP